MDYLDFYGFEYEPFSSAPISRFYFNSAQHSRAMVRLMYAIDTMKGLAVCIGDVGTGKTTLARRMLDNLPEEEYESALLVIIHSNITADWLLNRIARQIGIEDPAPEKLKLLNQLYGRLTELHESGKKAVVLIDEAQMLRSREIMEEFRGMLNLELPESKLITFVFFGLPEMEEHLQLDEPLVQRISVKCTLDSFNLESTEGYIYHRLRLAGAQTKIFTKDAIARLHLHSRGVPRLINTICDNCLFEGYLLKKKEIENDLVDSLAQDLGLIIQRPKPKKRVAKKIPAKVVPVQLPTQVPATVGAPSFETPPQAMPEDEVVETEQQSAKQNNPQQSGESTEVALQAAMENAGLFDETPEPEPEPESEPEQEDQDIDDMFENITSDEPETIVAKPAKKQPSAGQPQAQKPKADDDDDLDALLDSLEDD